MAQTLISVVLFLVVLALLPMAVRWLQQRTPRGSAAGPASRIVSTVAVGPQQRVVTVEVGPEHERIWLVLGVTPQHITRLHTLPVTPAEGWGPAARLARTDPAFADGEHD